MHKRDISYFIVGDESIPFVLSCCWSTNQTFTFSSRRAICF